MTNVVNKIVYLAGPYFLLDALLESFPPFLPAITLQPPVYPKDGDIKFEYFQLVLTVTCLSSWPQTPGRKAIRLHHRQRFGKLKFKI